MPKKTWWQNLKPGDAERLLSQNEQRKDSARDASLIQHFQQEAELRQAENERQTKNAEAMRARYDEQHRGGKLAWAVRLRETPQMRELRLAAEKERGADGR